MMTLIDDAKLWFSDGEHDVDLMLKMGVITLEQIVRMYKAAIGKQAIDC